MPDPGTETNQAAQTMPPPKTGVTIRMYRQGHGDCFLLCFPKSGKKQEPHYLLIDCGLWSNSEINRPMNEVIADIKHSTGGFIDVVLVTHEHMDHVNGFAKRDPVSGELCFANVKIGQLWLAWTEDPNDPLANELRERFNDTLLALAGADDHLSGAHGTGSSKRQFLRNLLSFETGDEDSAGTASAGDQLLASLSAIGRTYPTLPFREQARLAVAGTANKKAIKLLRDKLDGKDPIYLDPRKGPSSLQGVDGVRVYTLGPPRDRKLLLSLDPKGHEEFKLGLDGSTRSFAAAVKMGIDGAKARCFPPRFGITSDDLQPSADYQLGKRLIHAYGSGAQNSDTTQEVRDFFSDTYGPASWQKIDEEWLDATDELALRLNNEVNNTSAVIAIELPQTKKVLLFSGDAQRGSWISWSDLSWDVEGTRVTSRELLGRTVFYKVGHHGSHNATLNGDADGETANLSWLGRGSYAEQFVAVIPAHESWAIARQGWHHPLKSIQDELLKKARGRVFRSDVDRVARPANIDKAEWAKFRRIETQLYFEYTVLDN